MDIQQQPQKKDVRSMIRKLSWSAFLGLLILLFLSIYNISVYVKNLEQVKIIIELMDQKKLLDPKALALEEEILNALQNSIFSSKLMLGVNILLGVLFVGMIFYLGRSIKKEICKRIHSMDWIIERDEKC